MFRFQSRRLPTELLLLIADHLCWHRDVVAFGATCKDLYTLLVKDQRRSLEIDFHGSQTLCASLGAPEYRLSRLQAATVTNSGLGDDFGNHQDGLEHCRLEDCRWRLPAKNMVTASQLFSKNDCELAKGVKELTLSGYSSSQFASSYSLSSHPFIMSAGFKTIRPEKFKVDLGWNDWDIEVLHGMSETNLKVLKLPIRLTSDCVRLGQALSAMPSLVSLAITDIPDREEFLNELEHIGKGILSCASTLRELDIEMTNFNRPAPWDGDERFIEPEDNGFFFRKFFPCQTEEELFALCEWHFRHKTDPMVKAPLRLTKLRLKHVSLPWYSFGTIFNAITIKHLHLPYSKVDEQVWRFLETHAQLDSLTEVSYDMLSERFLDFLEGQSSLKELTFARPQNKYDATSVTFYGASPHMMIYMSNRAPPAGSDAGAHYPSHCSFMSSLERMTMLKHLALPADMYTITNGCLYFIATSLTSLEHLEIGFDYHDLVLQGTFVSFFLCGTGSLKKITFFSLKQCEPRSDFDATHFHAHIASLGDKVAANIKLVRYMPLDQVHGDPYGDIQVYYHREMPVDGERWMRLPPNECEQLFAEGRTPRIVPVGKWDWETEVKQNENRVGLERGAFGKPVAE